MLLAQEGGPVAKQQAEAWRNFLGQMGPGIDCAWCGSVFHGPMARVDLIDHLTTHAPMKPWAKPDPRGKVQKQDPDPRAEVYL